MALKLYLDDCAYSHSLRDLLLTAGHTVVTPADAGLTGRDDPVHLAFATANDLLCVTKNPDDFESLSLLHAVSTVASRTAATTPRRNMGRTLVSSE